MAILSFENAFDPNYKPPANDIPSLIDRYSSEFGVEPTLIESQSTLESGQDPSQTSDAGAVGVMQILPSTAKQIAAELGEVYSPQKLRDPETNVKWGTYHMKTLVDKFDGDRQLALAAYLGGETGVRKALAKHPTKKDALESIVDNFTGMNAWDYSNNILSGGGVKSRKTKALSFEDAFGDMLKQPETVATETPEGFKPVTKVPHPDVAIPEVQPVEAPEFITETPSSTTVADVPRVETKEVESQYFDVEQLFQSDKDPYKRAEALKKVPEDQREKIINKLPQNEQVNVKEKLAELETASPFLGGLVKTVGAATKAAGDVLFPSFDPYTDDINLQYVADTPEKLKEIADKHRDKDGKIKASVNIMSGRLGSFLQDVKRFEEHPAKKEAIEEKGKDIIGVGEVLDPFDYKKHKIQERISNLKKQDNSSAAALEKGDLGFVISQAIADAVMSDDPEQAKKAMELKDQFHQAVASAPEEQKGMFKNLYLSTLEMLSPMVKTGVKMAVPVVGQAWGGYEWTRQGMGDVYYDLVKAGVSHETARKISPLTGVVYAAVEQLQFGQIAKLARQIGNLKGNITKAMVNKTITKLLLKGLKEKGVDALKETSEEGIQRFVTDVGTELGKQIEGISEKELGEFLLESGKNVVEEMKTAGPQVGVLSLLGFGAGAAMDVKAVRERTIPETEIAPETQTVTTKEGIEVLPGGEERIQEATQKGLAEAGITPAQEVVETANPEETAPLSEEALSGAQRPTLNIPTTKKVEALAAQSETDLVEAVTGLNKFLPVEDKLNIETEPKQLKKDFDHQIDVMQGKVEKFDDLGGEKISILTKGTKTNAEFNTKIGEWLKDIPEGTRIITGEGEALTVTINREGKRGDKLVQITDADDFPLVIATIKPDGSVREKGFSVLSDSRVTKTLVERRKEAVSSEQKRRKEDVEEFAKDETTKPTAVEPTVEKEVVEKELPTIKEIEAEKESIAPNIPETVEKEEIGYPAKIVQEKFIGGKFEKPTFSEEYEALSSVEKHKALAAEKKLIDKQIAKMKEENATAGFGVLKILKDTLTKEQKKYSPAKVNKERREATQVKKYAETGKPTTKLTEQINEDLDVVFQEFEGKSITDLNNLLKGKYSEKQIKTAVEAIKKGNKDGKAAQDIRQEIGEYLQGGTHPEQIVDLATKEAGFSESTEGFFEEKPTKKDISKKITKAEKELKTGDLFEGKLPKSTKTQMEIREEEKKLAEKGGKADVTGLAMFEGGEGIVGGAEQKDIFDKPLTKKQKEAKRVAEKIDRDEKAFKEEMGVTEKQKVKAKIAKKQVELAKKRAEAKLKAKQPKKQKREGAVAKGEPKKKEAPDVLFKKGEPVAFKESIAEVKKAVSPQLWDKVDIKFATGFGLKGKRTLKKDETGAIWEEKGRLKVVINPSATSDKIAATLFHEVAGHAGAANVLRSNPEIHKKISGLYKGTKKSALQEKIRKAYKSELKDLSPEAQDDLVFAEWIATNVEEHLANPKKKGIAYQVWKTVKKFLTDLGIAKESVDDVINSMAKEIRKVSDVTAKISEKPLFSKDTEVRKELPFYSPTARKISELKQEKGVVPQIQSMIKKGQLKKAEVEWMGLEEFLKENPKATKTEVQDFVKANEVTVEESELGVSEARSDLISKGWTILDENEHGQLWQDDKGMRVYDKEMTGLTKADLGENDRFATAEEVPHMRGLREETEEGREVRYADYTLPGGENYRELLFKMPSKITEKDIPSGWKLKYMPNQKLWNLYDQNGTVQFSADDKQVVLDRLGSSASGAYTSSHWDEPNVFAHARVNDRTTPDGEKVLFVEEIQSDFAREYREQQSGIMKEIDSQWEGLLQMMKEDGILKWICP